MKCFDCPYYQTALHWNFCGITGAEFFHEQKECKLVNDDGSKNELEIQNSQVEYES